MVREIDSANKGRLAWCWVNPAAQNSDLGKEHVSLSGPAKELPFIQHSIQIAMLQQCGENSRVLCSDVNSPGVPQAHVALEKEHRLPTWCCLSNEALLINNSASKNQPTVFSKSSSQGSMFLTFHLSSLGFHLKNNVLFTQTIKMTPY